VKLIVYVDAAARCGIVASARVPRTMNKEQSRSVGIVPASLPEGTDGSNRCFPLLVAQGCAAYLEAGPANAALVLAACPKLA
jgi:hypothetical protein